MQDGLVSGAKLWFDVGIKRYTTQGRSRKEHHWLWFDVGIKRYTTDSKGTETLLTLWFDVGIKRYTTPFPQVQSPACCGLM